MVSGQTEQAHIALEVASLLSGKLFELVGDNLVSERLVKNLMTLSILLEQEWLYLMLW